MATTELTMSEKRVRGIIFFDCQAVAWYYGTGYMNLGRARSSVGPRLRCGKAAGARSRASSPAAAGVYAPVRLACPWHRPNFSLQPAVPAVGS
eukprot:SAG11_NODE_560_length_8528_cov_4.697710_4_plen_93_part_00